MREGQRSHVVASATGLRNSVGCLKSSSVDGQCVKGCKSTWGGCVGGCSTEVMGQPLIPPRRFLIISLFA